MIANTPGREEVTSGLAAVSSVARRVTGWGAALWFGVLLVGSLDVLFTYYGLNMGLIELNPIARVHLTLFGAWTLVGIKVLAIGMGIAGWRALRHHRMLVPAVFLICWGTAVLSNVVLIANTA